MGHLTRRLVIGAGASAVALGGGSWLACAAGGGGAVARLDRLDVLAAAMPDPARIGRAYRRTMGPEALEAAALARPHVARALATECPSTRLAVLRAGLRAEFAAGDVVVCERYVLSATECLVAALRGEAVARA